MVNKGLEMFTKMVKFSVEYPDLAPDRLLVIDMGKDTFEKILSSSRLEMIKAINNSKPKSVGELAKMLERPVESVSRDLKIPSNYGILELIQVGKMKKPVIEKDMLLVPLTS